MISVWLYSLMVGKNNSFTVTSIGFLKALNYKWKPYLLGVNKKAIIFVFVCR